MNHDNVNKSRPSKHYVILHKHVPSTPLASGHPEVMHKAAIHECDVNGVTCHVYFHAQAADTDESKHSRRFRTSKLMHATSISTYYVLSSNEQHLQRQVIQGVDRIPSDQSKYYLRQFFTGMYVQMSNRYPELMITCRFPAELADMSKRGFLLPDNTGINCHMQNYICTDSG